MKLLILGYGYTAAEVSAQLGAEWQVIGTSRQAEKIQSNDPEIVHFDEVEAVIADCSHLLITIPPQHGIDPVMQRYQTLIQSCQHLKWIGYLSTTGVYGDHQGAWVDENTPPQPDNERSQWRYEAEKKWLALGEACDVPTQLFRVAGIYGPSRNMIECLQGGEAKNIVKQGQVFSRIHVADLASIIIASIEHPQAGEIYNVCDDEPAASHDVLAYVAELMDLPVPEPIPYEQAALSPMAQSFYQSNRRVRNEKVKASLNIELKYPTYREGYRALIRHGAVKR